MSVPPIEILGQGLGQPSAYLFLITPSDTDNLQYVTRAIRVGTAGDLAVLTVAGQVVTIPDCLSGEVLPIQVQKVYSTNTTASGIMGMS